MPGDSDIDRRDVAVQPACRKADERAVGIDLGVALRLVHRLADGEFGLFHVGDITALHALAGALAGAKHARLAFGRDQRAPRDALRRTSRKSTSPNSSH